MTAKMAAHKLLKFSSAFNSALKQNYIRSAHHLASATYAQTLLNLPETKVTTLGNGFKVASEQSDSGISTVGLWIDAGSRYETEQTNGAANFVEHLAFKGTSQRSEKDLEREIQNMGAQFNAYTGREETAFYAKCLSTDVPQAVDILGDIVKNCKLDEQQIELQRNVIIRELNEIETDLKQVTFDHLHLTAYQGTPLAKTVFGPTENVKKISKADISYYIRNNFVAPRMALVSSGNFNHEDLVKLAEKHFCSIPYTYTGEIPDLHPCRFTGSEVRVRDDWFPFAHVAIAVDTCGFNLNNPDLYPLMLAKTIIGCWDKTLGSSTDSINKLTNNICGGKGCHSFEAFHTLYRDTGLWGLYFVVDGLSLDDFVFNLMNEWMGLCISINESDLAIAKNMLRSNLLQHLDNSTWSCADIGRQILNHGERIPFSEIDENIEEVTLKKMKDVCMKYIYDRCPAVAAVGPIEQLTDYTRIRKKMTSMSF